MPSFDNMSDDEIIAELQRRQAFGATFDRPAPAQPQDHREASYGGGYRRRNSKPTPVTTPSGETVLVRRMGLQGLMAAGLVESLDSLTAIVQNVTIPAAEGRPTSAEPKIDLSKISASQLEEMTAIMDKIVIYAVVEPEILPIPEPDENGKITLDDEAAYIDLVPDEDKAFIMSYVMGASKDLAAFREGSAALVESGNTLEGAEEDAR